MLLQATPDTGGLTSAGTLAICLAVAVVAVLVSDRMPARLPVPAVVLQLVGGVVVGPAVLGLAREDEVVAAFSELGLAMLLFLAGYEIEPARVRGRPLRGAVTAWGVALAVGLLVGTGVVGLTGEGTALTGLVIGLALTTTALGTILPIVQDAGVLESRFGTHVLAVGAVGEFGPILAIALLLSGQAPTRTATALLVFAALSVALLVVAQRPTPPRLLTLIARTLHTSGQLVVLLMMLMVLVMVWLAGSLGLDVLLGAFTAGLVARAFLAAGADETVRRATVHRLEGIGFGLLIPIFFVVSGMRFDLRSLLAEPRLLLLVPLFLALFLLVRGVPVWLVARRDLPSGERVALGLYGATALPLVVVITTIGMRSGGLPAGVAAALVGAGMVSVLVLPLVANRLLGRAAAGHSPAARPGAL
ncbi:MAG TPA: cation:proton antiporter [Actinotalea sp.]|nr:cation:proton antiporter [Actinotalea sp.]